MQELKNSLILFLIFTALTGLVFPLFITSVAQILWNKKANGSLITKNKTVIGSKLIGQMFTSPKYFHGRSSSSNYSGDISGGSNFGPTNKKFIDEVQERIDKVRAGLKPALTPIPPDLVLSSGSGLDPHISLESALLQVERIAVARNIAQEKIQELIKENTEPPQFGFLGEERVNVLKLNLKLDKLTKS